MYEIDVVIPTYNRAHYLELAINSVLNQTYESFNLYILDNCSNDNTNEILDKFSSLKINYIKNDTNLGMVGNWNRALKTGTSNLLHIFHDDDILDKCFLYKVAKFYKEHENVVYLHTGAVIIDKNNRLKNKYLFDYPKLINSETFFINYLTRGMRIICPSVVINRSKLPSEIRFDDNLAFTADINFWVKISKYGNVGYINEPLVRYLQHNNSGTESLYKNFHSKLNDRFYFKNFLENEIKERLPYNNQYKNIPQSYLNNALAADILFLHLQKKSLFKILKIVRIIVKRNPNIIREGRFWLNLLIIIMPLFVIDFFRKIKNLNK